MKREKQSRWRLPNSSPIGTMTSFPWGDPSTQMHVHSSRVNISPFSFAWQVHHRVLACLHFQIKAEDFPSTEEISSNLSKVASSFRTWLHDNGANYGASYQNKKPQWSPQLTLLRQDLGFRGTIWKHLPPFKPAEKNSSHPNFHFLHTNLEKMPQIKNKTKRITSLYHVYTFSFSCQHLSAPTHKRPLQGKKCV